MAIYFLCKEIKGFRLITELLNFFNFVFMCLFVWLWSWGTQATTWTWKLKDACESRWLSSHRVHLVMELWALAFFLWTPNTQDLCRFSCTELKEPVSAIVIEISYQPFACLSGREHALLKLQGWSLKSNDFCQSADQLPTFSLAHSGFKLLINYVFLVIHTQSPLWFQCSPPD